MDHLIEWGKQMRISRGLIYREKLIEEEKTKTCFIAGLTLTTFLNKAPYDISVKV